MCTFILMRNAAEKQTRKLKIILIIKPSMNSVLYSTIFYNLQHISATQFLWFKNEFSTRHFDRDILLFHEITPL